MSLHEIHSHATSRSRIVEHASAEQGTYHAGDRYYGRARTHPNPLNSSPNPAYSPSAASVHHYSPPMTSAYSDPPRSGTPAPVKGTVRTSGFRYEVTSTTRVGADKLKELVAKAAEKAGDKATDLAGRLAKNALYAAEELKTTVKALPADAKKVASVSVEVYETVCNGTKESWKDTAGARRNLGWASIAEVRALMGLPRYHLEHFRDVRTGLDLRSDGQPHTEECRPHARAEDAGCHGGVYEGT